LPPNHVPRDGEKVGEEDDEGFTYKRREKERPSGVLEDILVGLSLKSAKERFEGRKWAAKEEFAESRGEEEGLVAAPGSGSEEEDEDVEPVIKEGPKETEYLRPIVSADDERSREILLPTVRHTLSKLDDVLMALHHARKTCRRYSSVSAPDSDDEFHSAVEEEQDVEEVEDIPRVTKPVGRPKKFENLTHRGRPDEVEEEEEEEDRTFMPTDHLRPKKPGRGRNPKQYPRLEAENDREYLIRVARLQKKPIPLFSDQAASPSPVRKSPQRVPSPSPVRKPPKKSPTPRKNSAPPEERARKRQKGLGLRDWSEVLGSAALVGFPPDVIARATQRCANIFGEGMSMRTMIEGPFDAEDADTLTTYQPEPIPDFASESDSAESSDDDSDASIPENIYTSRQSRPVGLAPKVELCFCPIPNCPRQIRGFNSTHKMREHLKNGHKMSMEQIKEFEVPSDEEMDGAVHVDGFLRPGKRVLRGPDRKPRKRRKAGKMGVDVEKVEDLEDEVEVEPSEESEERGWTTSEEEDGPGRQSEEE